MSARHHVFLVPGFFGFDRLGDLRYFQHVERALEERFARDGREVLVRSTVTAPTASIRKRAARLDEQVVAELAPEGPVHLIGHSTGGLDARLVTSPQVDLAEGSGPEAWAGRVRTVVSVATPHRGAPIASFFSTVFGRQLLGLLSYATVQVLRTGELPAGILSVVSRWLGRLDASLGGSTDLMDTLAEGVLDDFTPERRAAVRRFLEEVSAERQLLGQLTPEGIDLLNASATDRPGVRYGSVVTRARRPGMTSLLSGGTSPAAQGSHLLYVALYNVAGRDPGWLARLAPDRERELAERFGSTLSEHANDGIVPTRSQPWGELLAAAAADHLDVIGHFDDGAAEPPHHDWLTSGSGFRRPGFDAVWDAVYRFLVADEPSAGDG